MILKKVEKNGVTKSIYKSSHILASSYDSNDLSLTVTFDRGAQYKYEGVSVQDYTRFEIAESQGKVLNSHIKPNYQVNRLDDIDPTKIVAEVDKHQASMLAELEAEIVKAMDGTIKHYANKDEMSEAMLTKVQHLISKYQYEKK